MEASRRTQNEIDSERVTKGRGLPVLCYIGDLIPEKKCVSADVPVLLSGQAVALTPEGIVDLTMCRQKALCMAG